ncbi:MAG: hypothetical protein WB626_04555, partial [Bacteroidota bacterium]
MTQEQLPFAGPSLRQILEALVFAADEPLTPAEILAVVTAPEDGQAPRRLSAESVTAVVEEVNR